MELIRAIKALRPCPLQTVNGTEKAAVKHGLSPASALPSELPTTPPVLKHFLPLYSSSLVIMPNFAGIVLSLTLTHQFDAEHRIS